MHLRRLTGLKQVASSFSMSASRDKGLHLEGAYQGINQRSSGKRFVIWLAMADKHMHCPRCRGRLSTLLYVPGWR